ncbi:hypothetical protein Q361_1692 [Flavobacterium croceum DSM 17960]|uniref:Uncharacterized protein n=1 Tax=Flavobacterium croceum DSM 17960 TaxID=1121886 RepID=A0A2S4N4C4_9FLAO|nr:hypothetical protein [Flavobacterium croceum]POS00541.1 hypothetical protein Q361_1692 [Flavobacterium croceum DSM 17960]
MKINKKIIYLFAVLCLVSCKKEIQIDKDSIMDITKKKWLVYDNSFQSSWKATIMPIILDFEKDKVSLNFSNSVHKYDILGDDLFLDGKSVFKITYNEDNTLTLHNNDEVRNYFALSEGVFTNIDKSTFENILTSKTWFFKDLDAKFSGTEIDFYDKQGEFIKSGFYTTALFNKEILMFLKIDGENEKETYIINSINKDRIILKKVLKENKFQTITLTEANKS